MGIGTAAVTLNCGSGPNFDERWHPWVEPVTGSIPYVPSFYATTTHESDGLGLRVRTIEGRATLIHGNPLHPFSHGPDKGVGTLTARQQSVIECLYGPGRVRKPRTKDGNEITWRQLEALVKEKVQAAHGKPVHALTGVFSGATAEIWTRFVAEMGNGKVTQYAPFSGAAQLLASEKVFGRSEVPLVSLKGADMVLSLGARFLETWGNVTDHMKHYADLRDIKADHGHAQKRGIHVQVEARTSGTGANADSCLHALPGCETQLSLALLKEVAAHSSSLSDDEKAKVNLLTAHVSLESAASEAGLSLDKVKHLAQALGHAKAAVVLPAEDLSLGDQAVMHHAAVLLLNKALGAIGRFYNYEASKGLDRVPSHNGIAELIKSLNAGGVELLIVKGTNPAYNLPKNLNFAAAFAKAGFSIAFSDSMDETAALADVVIPVTHDLESWGEVNSYTGIDMLMQPVMRPRWQAKQAEDHLIDWLLAANPGSLAQSNYHEYLKASWGSRFPGSWRDALKLGGNFNLAEGTDQPLSGNLAASYFAQAKGAISGTSLLLIDSANLGDGFAANRGWMQELPESMTGVTWDSWLEMSAQTAAGLNVSYGDLVAVKVGSVSLEVPAFLSDTISNNVVTLATGQGHSHFSDEYNRGVNAFELFSGKFNDAGCYYAGPMTVSLSATGVKRPLATPHIPGVGDQETTRLHTISGGWQERDPHYSRGIFQTVALKQGSAAEHGHEEDHGDHHFDDAYLNPDSKFARHKTRVAKEYRGFYPDRSEQKVYMDREETFYDTYKWEMAVDLNRCTGCASCVTACYGENNLPVVGRDQVIKGREMSWIRINRYLSYTKDSNEVTVGMMPMMCQQCANAPCESVCPSLATYHTKEGLNAMVYNRCVGTRYCSNNCSYKVRRFNWYTWEFPGDMRWQMNPAVSVRQKGVMEKCTFCQQRIREAKSQAMDKGRTVLDGDVTTACQDACPAQAISFGNATDKASQVAHAAQDERAYKALDSHIQTKPGISYLRRVTLAGDEHHG